MDNFNSYWITDDGKLVDVSHIKRTHDGYAATVFNQIERKGENASSYAISQKGWIRITTFQTEFASVCYIKKVTDEALKTLKEFCENNQKSLKKVHCVLYNENNTKFRDIDKEIQDFIDNFYKYFNYAKELPKRSLRDVLYKNEDKKLTLKNVLNKL